MISKWTSYQVPIRQNFIKQILPIIHPTTFNQAQASPSSMNNFINPLQVPNSQQPSNISTPSTINDEMCDLKKLIVHFRTGNLSPLNDEEYEAITSKLPCSLRPPRNLNEAFIKLINQWIEEHGYLLTNRFLCYLTASRSGLTELEMEDILSLDDEVIISTNQQEKILSRLTDSIPLVRVSSLSVLSLKQDMSLYLTEKDDNGFLLFNWKHKEIGYLVQEVFMKDHNYKKKIHSVMADYWLGTWSMNKPKWLIISDDPKLTEQDRRIQTIRGLPSQHLSFSEIEIDSDYERVASPSPSLDSEPRTSTPAGLNNPYDVELKFFNRRKIIELPWHLVFAGRHEEFYKEVTFNYQFLHAKCALFSRLELLEDLILPKTVYEDFNNIRMNQHEESSGEDCEVVRDSLHFPCAHSRNCLSSCLSDIQGNKDKPQNSTETSDTDENVITDLTPFSALSSNEDDASLKMPESPLEMSSETLLPKSVVSESTSTRSTFTLSSPVKDAADATSLELPGKNFDTLKHKNFCTFDLKRSDDHIYAKPNRESDEIYNIIRVSYKSLSLTPSNLFIELLGRLNLQDFPNDLCANLLNDARKYGLIKHSILMPRRPCMPSGSSLLYEFFEIGLGLGCLVPAYEDQIVVFNIESNIIRWYSLNGTLIKTVQMPVTIPLSLIRIFFNKMRSPSAFHNKDISLDLLEISEIPQDGPNSNQDHQFMQRKARLIDETALSSPNSTIGEEISEYNYEEKRRPKKFLSKSSKSIFFSHDAIIKKRQNPSKINQKSGIAQAFSQQMSFNIIRVDITTGIVKQSFNLPKSWVKYFCLSNIEIISLPYLVSNYRGKLYIGNVEKQKFLVRSESLVKRNSLYYCSVNECLIANQLTGTVVYNLRGNFRSYQLKYIDGIEALSHAMLYNGSVVSIISKEISVKHASDAIVYYSVVIHEQVRMNDENDYSSYKMIHQNVPWIRLSDMDDNNLNIHDCKVCAVGISQPIVAFLFIPKVIVNGQLLSIVKPPLDVCVGLIWDGRRKKLIQLRLFRNYQNVCQENYLNNNILWNHVQNYSSVTQSVFSNDGSLLFTPGTSCILLIWSVFDGALLRILTKGNAESMISGLMPFPLHNRGRTSGSSQSEYIVLSYFPEEGRTYFDSELCIESEVERSSVLCQILDVASIRQICNKKPLAISVKSNQIINCQPYISLSTNTFDSGDRDSPTFRFHDQYPTYIFNDQLSTLLFITKRCQYDHLAQKCQKQCHEFYDIDGEPNKLFYSTELSRDKLMSFFKVLEIKRCQSLSQEEERSKLFLLDGAEGVSSVVSFQLGKPVVCHVEYLNKTVFSNNLYCEKLNRLRMNNQGHLWYGFMMPEIGVLLRVKYLKHCLYFDPRSLKDENLSNVWEINEEHCILGQQTNEKKPRRIFSSKNRPDNHSFIKFTNIKYLIKEFIEVGDILNLGRELETMKLCQIEPRKNNNSHLIIGLNEDHKNISQVTKTGKNIIWLGLLLIIDLGSINISNDQCDKNNCIDENDISEELLEKKLRQVTEKKGKYPRIISKCYIDYGPEMIFLADGLHAINYRLTILNINSGTPIRQINNGFGSPDVESLIVTLFEKKTNDIPEKKKFRLYKRKMCDKDKVNVKIPKNVYNLSQLHSFRNIFDGETEIHDRENVFLTKIKSCLNQSFILGIRHFPDVQESRKEYIQIPNKRIQCYSIKTGQCLVNYSFDNEISEMWWDKNHNTLIVAILNESFKTFNMIRKREKNNRGQFGLHKPLT